MTTKKKQTRLWAEERSWVFQESVDGGKTWTSTKWYQNIDSLARHELNQRARGRVARGRSIVDAMRLAAKDLEASLGLLHAAVRERLVDIPSTQKALAGRKGNKR